MFERKIYNKLLEWKNESAGKTALLIEGARRVGKSTVAEEFAKKEYKSYILIDFSKAIRDLKHDPQVPPEEGIRRTVEWMKDYYRIE